MAEADPKIYRTIIFVRHGQYQSLPQKLTTLGRAQAQLVAGELKTRKASKLYCSDMPRAKETASILARKLKLKPKVKSFFREALLPATEEFFEAQSLNKSATEKNELKKKMNLAQKKANEAFKFIMRPPLSGSSTEIVVAHGNVIRHWVCRALNIESANWIKMDVIHASLTTLRIDATGKCMLLGFSDCGHLPYAKRTYV